MIAELGQIFLLLALMAAIYQAAMPLVGVARHDGAMMRAARSGALVQLGFIVLAFLALTVVHATSDFSVLNVFENSHSAKPAIYKLTGVWGNHEGSMLLWILILAFFGGALAMDRRVGEALRCLALGIQGLLSAAFLGFLIFTSNPFARLAPTPVDGRDLNPLLQDPGLAIHPPFLYFGYVGFSIVFAFAAAGLIQSRIDRDWARAVRPYALAAWTFLTIGIGIGSWWAYYELGWGGFWAWDPVENASFMPWLTGLALIHSNRVLEVRDGFRAWTTLLAILTFSLSLIGTFLVRSGILTSVHAFAVDPARGVVILVILGASIGGALMLFALRGAALTSHAQFEPVSREGGLLANNVVIVSSCATVFIGTFYPLFAEMVTGEKLAVGAPYFNIVFVPFALLALFFLAPATALAWKRGNLGRSFARLWPVAGAGLAAGMIALAVARPISVAAIAATALAIWAGGGVLIDLVRRVRPLSPGARERLAGVPRSTIAMTIAHLGFAVLTLGVVGAGAWKSESFVYASPGDTVRVAGYEATLRSIEPITGPNYQAERAIFDVARAGRGGSLGTIETERRFYPVRGMQTTEAGIRTSLSGDLYLTVGERNPDRGWIVRAWVHPLTIWMWIGTGLVSLGGLVALWPSGARSLSLRSRDNKDVLGQAVGENVQLSAGGQLSGGVS